MAIKRQSETILLFLQEKNCIYSSHLMTLSNKMLCYKGFDLLQTRPMTIPEVGALVVLI